MIRIGTLQDIDRIIEITKACAKTMVKNDIYQWNEHYPNKAAFENDVLRGELYVLEDSSQLIGCVVISTFMNDEYIPISWLTKNNNNVYIHRLAIHPKYQGKGYAQELMTFAENFAKENNHVSVRLDTFSQNHRNHEFYEQRRYKRLGSIFFPNQSDYPFYCYELVF